MKKETLLFNVSNSVGRIKGFSLRRDEGSIFWFGHGRREKLHPPVSHYRFRTLFWLVIVFMLIIITRIFWLQIVNGHYYNTLAEGNRLRTKIIKAERGIIYDRFNRPLVTNIPHYTLSFIPADLPPDYDARKNLSSKLAMNVDSLSAEKILEIFQASDPYSYRPEIISNGLNHQDVVALSIVIDDLAGINLSIEPRRHYLEGAALSHVLGYVGKINTDEFKQLSGSGYTLNDYLGKNGIEAYYENYLRGTDGREEIEVNARGKAKKVFSQTKPVTGQSVILTIDIDLQQKLAEVLSQAIKNSKSAHGGVGIALDPESGEVLALVSLPGFDNNFFSAGIDAAAYTDYLNDPSEPLFNRAISGTYPPGSTFKPIVALAALEEGLINESTSFLSTGGLHIGQWYFPDWKYGGHGRTNVIKAIAESVNTFFYYIGGGYNDFVGLGVNRITEYARRFYFSKRLGIDLPGEAAGFLPSKEWKESYKKERWYIGDTYHLAIGQGDILVTPLQLAAATAAIANHGTLYQPHLIKGIKNKNNGQIKNNSISFNQDYILNKNFASAANIDIVRRGLRAAVLKGSARSLKYLPVSAAGKTGTAQVGGDKKAHAWFTGFAPYENPKIALTILVENGGEGSSVAVPVFKEIINWYFSED